MVTEEVKISHTPAAYVTEQAILLPAAAFTAQNKGHEVSLAFTCNEKYYEDNCLFLTK